MKPLSSSIAALETQRDLLNQQLENFSGSQAELQALRRSRVRLQKKLFDARIAARQETQALRHVLEEISHRPGITRREKEAIAVASHIWRSLPNRHIDAARTLAAQSGILREDAG